MLRNLYYSDRIAPVHQIQLESLRQTNIQADKLTNRLLYISLACTPRLIFFEYTVLRLQMIECIAHLQTVAQPSVARSLKLLNYIF